MPQSAILKRETREIKPAQLRAAFDSTTFNEAERTVEVVWTTGSKGLRFGWSGNYYEELSLDPAHVRMGRMEKGAPVLDTHSRYQLSDVLGVVEKAWLTATEGRALIRFSSRADVVPIMQDVKEGILRNISVGYTVFTYEIIESSDDKIPTYRATDWEPAEISFVPVGFDADAQVRSAPSTETRSNPVEIITRGAPAIVPIGEITMTEEEIRAAAELKQRQEAERAAARELEIRTAQEAAAAQARAAERTRISDIVALVARHGLPATFAEKLTSTDTTVEAARAAVLDELHRVQSTEQPNTQSHGRIQVVGEAVVKRQAAIENALLNRASPGTVALLEDARQFRGMTLMDMARDAIESAGGNWRGMNQREIASAALNQDGGLRSRAGMNSTSDFPIILGNTVNRSLRDAYELAAPTFKPFSRRSNANDFRDIIRAQLGDISRLEKVLEGGEYKYGTVGEASEKYRVAKYGKIIALTWETLINDDLDAFSRIPRSFGDAAAQLESDIVYGLFTGSANPTMGDTGALFNTTAITTAGGHANLAGSGGAIDLTTLGAARAAMAKQKSMGDGKVKGSGYFLNLMPKYLVVGPDYAQLAYQYTSSAYVPTTAAGVQIPQNVALQVIVDGRLTGNQWYLIGDPARVDTIEYAYLAGEEGIFTETRQGFEVDGVEIKVRHVFGAAVIDWRNMYKNAGA